MTTNNKLAKGEDKHLDDEKHDLRTQDVSLSTCKEKFDLIYKELGDFKEAYELSNGTCLSNLNWTHLYQQYDEIYSLRYQNDALQLELARLKSRNSAAKRRPIVRQPEPRCIRVDLSDVSAANQKYLKMIRREDSIDFEIDYHKAKAKRIIPGFEWSELDKHEQVDCYMAYLNQHLCKELQKNALALFDVHTKQDLLNCEFYFFPPQTCYLCGGADVLLTDKLDYDNIKNARLVIDVKKKMTTEEEMILGRKEAFAKFVAAQEVMRDGVVLFTDLNNVWNFLWYSKSRITFSLLVNEPYAAFILIKLLMRRSVDEWEYSIPFAKDVNFKRTNDVHFKRKDNKLKLIKRSLLRGQQLVARWWSEMTE